MTPREQGDFGERSALNWLADQGAHVYLPFGHSPDIDLVAELDGRLIRVEVKTGTARAPSGTWSLMIATCGGNQSWNRVVKTFEPERCDFLFAHVGDGRRWFIPTDALGAKTSISLGGPKYSEYEIESGSPILRTDNLETASPASKGLSTIIRSLRGSVGVGEPIRSVKSEAQPEWVRIPPPPSVADDEFPKSLGKYRTKTWGHRSTTIPKGCFEEAGLSVGDRLAVRALGRGRVLFTRIDPEPGSPQPLGSG